MKTYFKLILALYYAALAAMLACRVWLKLFHMDAGTGFYTGGDRAVVAFNAMLAAVPVIMFVSNRLKKTDNDYPVAAESWILSPLAVMAGLSILAFTFVGMPEPNLEQAHSEMFYQVTRYVNLSLGGLAGLSFLYLGARGALVRKRPPSGLLVIIPPIWQSVLVITRFNGYTTVTSISDNLLAVLFMVFCGLFLMGHARTVCLHMRKDGRNYAIPAGLCASLCGFLLVIPNYVYMAVYGAPMPALQLGLFESAYVLIMSIYALVFVAGIIRSVKNV